MVNHAYTLLLNMTEAGIAASGGADRTWFIDPSFRHTVDIPPGTARARDSIYAGAVSVQDRVDRTVGAVSMAMVGDMRRHFDWLDPRVTVRPVDVGSIRGLYGSSGLSCDEYMTGVVRSTLSSSGVFVGTGRDDIDSAMSEFMSVLGGASEMPVRYSAAVLAVLYSMEAARRSQNGR